MILLARSNQGGPFGMGNMAYKREERCVNIFGGEPDGRKPFRRHSMDCRDRLGGVRTRFIWPNFSRMDVLHGVNFK